MARSSRHWYTLGPDGKINEAHHLGIKDARKARAFVSPTTVIQEVRATPFHLDRWKRQQLVAACIDAPILQNETVEDYYLRVNELSFRKSDVATDFGKRVHSIAEHYPAKQIDPQLEPWYDQFKIWYEERVEVDLGQEERVADMQLGMAGTLDRRIVRRRDQMIEIDDIKTQGIKDRVYYGESWPKQLAFYANAVRKRDGLPMNPKCANAIMDSTAPNPIITKEWSDEEINEAYRDLICELWLWSRDNRHWPVGPWNLSDVLNNPYLCPK